MTLDEVKRLVVNNHDGLEELMDDLEQLANRYVGGDASAERELRSLSLEMAAQLHRHLTFEERHWYPHLHSSLTTRQLSRQDVQHQKQRRCIDLLRDRAHAPAAGELVGCIFNLVRHFRRHTRLENLLLAI